MFCQGLWLYDFPSHFINNADSGFSRTPRKPQSHRSKARWNPMVAASSAPAPQPSNPTAGLAPEPLGMGQGGDRASDDPMTASRH